MNLIKLLLFKILPLKLISRTAGKITNASLPTAILQRVLKWFIKKYSINTDEMEKEITEYKTVNDFFIRYLKPGARKIDAAKKSLVSPVDGRVLTFGGLEEGKIIQAKGMGSTLDELIDMPGYRKRFQGGTYIIIYLSPKDYHRIHSPLAGDIVAMSYLPGKLFPVNTFAVNNIDRLFSINERVVTYIESAGKLCGLIKVGATNVGSIKLSYYDSLRTNTKKPDAQSQVFMKKIPIKKGEQVARFELGSTVILLLEKGFSEIADVEEFSPVRYGEKIGILNY
ncbi:MAG: archaetidylserine decarboxylase [Leptospirales bacterium]